MFNTKPFTGQRFAGQTQSAHKQTQENEKGKLIGEIQCTFC